MRTKQELLDMMIHYKAHHYSDIKLRSAIGSEKGSSFYDLVESHREVEGAVAEVGVWRGGSTLLLADLLPNKTIWAFDTFEGLPYHHPQDNFHVTGQFDQVDFDEITSTLREWSNIKLVKGIFPQSSAGIFFGDERFSIVHIDVDMYKAYHDCLAYFWNKMVPGGIILLDDYAEPTCEGATIATDEFMADKVEIVENLGTQYYIKKN